MPRNIALRVKEILRLKRLVVKKLEKFLSNENGTREDKLRVVRENRDARERQITEEQRGRGECINREVRGGGREREWVRGSYETNYIKKKINKV